MSVNRIDAILTDDQPDRADSHKFGDKHRAFVVKAIASPGRTPICCRAVSISRNFAPPSNSSKVSTAPPV